MTDTAGREEENPLIDIEAVARALRRVTYNLYSAVLCGSPNGNQRAIYERIKAPRIGDLVSGMTTTIMGQTGSLGIGFLEEMTREPVNFGEGAEPWDEVSEGRPHPTEEVFYIRNFNGKLSRWTNEKFIVCLTELIR